MKKRYLIHYVLESFTDKYKHIHKSVEIEHDGYIESLSSAYSSIAFIIKKYKDNFNITIVGWQLI